MFAKLRPFVPLRLTCLRRLRALHAFVSYTPSRLTYLTYAPYLSVLRAFFKEDLYSSKKFPFSIKDTTNRAVFMWIKQP